MKKKIISLILGTAMVVSALTGCGGGGNTAGDSAPAETPAPAESSEETAGEAENAGGGAGGETEPAGRYRFFRDCRLPGRRRKSLSMVWRRPAKI